MRKGFSDLNWKIEEMIGEKNIVVRWIFSGTHDGEFMGVKPTENKFSICVMNFYYFNNGKLLKILMLKE